MRRNKSRHVFIELTSKMSHFPGNTVSTKEDNLSLILNELSILLTKSENFRKVFKIHTKQLSTLGDLSFQTNLKFVAWKELKVTTFQDASEESDKFVTIFDFASKLYNKKVNEDTIPAMIDEYNNKFRIAKCCVIKSNCHIFLNRQFFIKTVLNDVISNINYGIHKLNSSVNILCENLCADGLECNLTDLRMKILYNITKNFIHYDAMQKEEGRTIYLTNKSSDTHESKILCGCVLNDKGQKEETLTAADLYDEYAGNMRMMFEHRFGVRNISNYPQWKQKIDKLGHAAVTFQMIQNTPQKTISLTSKHHVIKDAAFVIYNGARISRLLKRFEVEVLVGMHKQLPAIADIDFSTLSLHEEWELVFVYLVQFPNVIRNCVSGIDKGKLSFQKLYEFLVNFATVFSAYYSRFKIITDIKDYLLPTMYARIYLLKSFASMLKNALCLLNIELINQM